jgi:hypothetical protein
MAVFRLDGHRPENSVHGLGRSWARGDESTATAKAIELAEAGAVGGWVTVLPLYGDALLIVSKKSENEFRILRAADMVEASLERTPDGIRMTQFKTSDRRYLSAQAPDVLSAVEKVTGTPAKRISRASHEVTFSREGATVVVRVSDTVGFFARSRTRRFPSMPRRSVEMDNGTPVEVTIRSDVSNARVVSPALVDAVFSEIHAASNSVEVGSRRNLRPVSVQRPLVDFVNRALQAYQQRQAKGSALE